MKEIRQAKILEIIKDNSYDTQEDIQKKLLELGFKVTQATISRDIRELGIVKSEGGDGEYKYRRTETPNRAKTESAFASILRQAALSVARANNLVVVKTYTGMGSAVGAAVDALGFTGVVGTLAGDDTLLVIENTFRELIG